MPPNPKRQGKRGAISEKIYGYIRVSSVDRNEDRQKSAMREQAIPEKNIYTDKQSGKDLNRPPYKKLVKRLKRAAISMGRIR